ncbi:MAG TPA: NADH-quinone oxidoreductase subunit A [Gemmatimonadaceae bacterium]|nr:NADH-quinone oxidoreductase subunit A [Gemmatimonadaceae bacterium]
MARAYFPLLLLIGFVVANAVMMVAVSHLVIRRRPTPVKQTPYESGIPVLGDARERFSVKFYMVAISFIIFDVETVLLFPWAAQFKNLSCLVPLQNGACPAGQTTIAPFIAMLIFVIVLTVGLVYEWKKGALQWD